MPIHLISDKSVRINCSAYTCKQSFGFNCILHVNITPELAKIKTLHVTKSVQNPRFC